MTSKPTFRVPWYQRWGGAAIALGMRTAMRTIDCRVAHYDRTMDPILPEFSEPIIGVFWHEYIALPVGVWSGGRVTMLVSQHRDAEWLNQAAERLGFSVVRGSTRRGGSKAILQLRQLCKTNSLGITPDGPQGPRRQMSLGPIFLASLFGMPVVPIGAGFRRPWRANTWDQFALGRPFSRARLICGPKIYVPKRLNRDDMEDYRVYVERMLQDLTAQAEDWAHGDYHIRGEMRYLRGKLVPESTRSSSIGLTPEPRAAA